MDSCAVIKQALEISFNHESLWFHLGQVVIATWDKELLPHLQPLKNIKSPDLLNHNMHSHTELIDISSRLVLDKIHEVRLSSAQNSFFFESFFFLSCVQVMKI